LILLYHFITMKRIEHYKLMTLVQEITPLQIQLSKDYILPNLNELEFFCHEFREKLDSLILKNSNLEILQPFQSLKKEVLKLYPIGRCSEITDSFLIYLNKNTPDFLIKFQENGGIIKRVWGNIRNEFFQTAVQMGSYIIDVSNDTVDIKKPKININLLNEIQFSNIQTISEYISIKKSYHNADIYLNNVVPELFDEYPLIQICDNKMKFITNPCIIYLLKEKREELPKNLPTLNIETFVKIKNFFNNSGFNSLTPELMKNKQNRIVEFFNNFFN
jgi:hypothetical protein